MKITTQYWEKKRNQKETNKQLMRMIDLSMYIAIINLGIGIFTNMWFQIIINGLILGTIAIMKRSYKKWKEKETI